MYRKNNSGWFALAALATGFLCQAGGCVNFATPADAEAFANQVGLAVQQTVATVAADSMFFLLDNLLVNLGV